MDTEIPLRNLLSTDFLVAPDVCVFATSKRNTFVIALRSHACTLRKADVLYFKKCKENIWKFLVRKNVSSEILGAPAKKTQRSCGPSDSQLTIACTEPQGIWNVSNY